MGLEATLLVRLAFMLVSTHFVYVQHYSREDLVAVDTSRIAASTALAVVEAGPS
jgi:putative Mg2+ transporter-C (MgtC) family protein